MGLTINSITHKGVVYSNLYLRLVYERVDPSNLEVVIRFVVYANKSIRDNNINTTLEHFKLPNIRVTTKDFITYFATPYSNDVTNNSLKHYHYYGYIFAKSELKGIQDIENEIAGAKKPYNRFLFNLNDSNNVSDVFEAGQEEELGLI